MRKKNTILLQMVIICSIFIFSQCNQMDILSRITLDDLSPYVKSVNPVNNQTGVSVSTFIRITFSEEMNIKSANFAFNLFKSTGPGEEPVDGTKEWENERTLTFKLFPGETLEPISNYRIYVSQVAKDKQDNALKNNFNSVFTTIGYCDVSAGETHSLFLKDDGTLWACGANGSYQTGIDENVEDKHLIQRVSGIPDIRFISCGMKFSLAATSLGAVYGWGDNVNKQLGTQASGEITMPKLIEGISDVIALGGGFDFSIALTRDKYVYGWGNSSNGVLGCDPLPNPYYRETPGLVLKIDDTPLSNVKQISVGYGFVLALDGNGEVWGWGNNNFGQLAQTDATLPDEFAPYAIKIQIPTTIKVAAGIQHSIALLDDGEVMTWGRNYSGQLGVDKEHSELPYTEIPNHVVRMLNKSKLNNIIDIGAGLGDNTFALDSNGTVWICGQNKSGQSGTGSTSPDYYCAAIPVPGLPNNIIKIAGSKYTVLAFTSNGEVYAWGANYYGQTGLNQPGVSPITTPQKLDFNLLD